MTTEALSPPIGRSRIVSSIMAVSWSGLSSEHPLLRSMRRPTNRSCWSGRTRALGAVTPAVPDSCPIRGEFVDLPHLDDEPTIRVTRAIASSCGSPTLTAEPV
ncbi:hypothetical protein [Actinophytocola gossypii]|uniref:Uncharacterized protein n=1 Tax=Actinophytocola gossypii TaxID=2812003 RepID=A0ABT2JIH5_9PSEU|nr:hypothetical protein [Actinophytocola gossypii]MCT2587685.1 hypothetical protein [Actinophytocola gossypii]